VTLTIELTLEEEVRLKQEAASLGVSEAEFVHYLIEQHLLDQEPKPRTGAEIIAYWERVGALGSYGDPNLDSL
jgi:hypothetical protein